MLLKKNQISNLEGAVKLSVKRLGHQLLNWAVLMLALSK